MTATRSRDTAGMGDICSYIYYMYVVRATVRSVSMCCVLYIEYYNYNYGNFHDTRQLTGFFKDIVGWCVTSGVAKIFFRGGGGCRIVNGGTGGGG